MVTHRKPYNPPPPPQKYNVTVFMTTKKRTTIPRNSTQKQPTSPPWDNIIFLYIGHIWGYWGCKERGTPQDHMNDNPKAQNRKYTLRKNPPQRQ